MTTGTLVTILVIALAVVVLLFLVRAGRSGRRRPALRALPVESRERYINEWDSIESKFVDSPEQAVREAETLVMSVLRDRGHSLAERDLPVEMKRAHKLGYESKDRTEGMRQAMLHYRTVMEKMVGPEDQVRRDRVREDGRREMA